MKCPDCGREMQLKGTGCACDEMMAVLLRDDEHIVLVTPETKRQLDEAQEWYGRIFKPALKKHNPVVMVVEKEDK